MPTRRYSRRRGQVGFSRFITRSAPAAAERGRSATEGLGVRLASEDALAAAAPAFEQVRSELRGYRADLLDDPVAGWCLRNYVLLTERPDLVGGPLSEQELHWSRYYWLFRFTRIWYALAGYDEGMEQQLFWFLEYPPDGADCWPQEEIEAAARQHAAEQLQAAGMPERHAAPGAAADGGGM